MNSLRELVYKFLTVVLVLTTFACHRTPQKTAPLADLNEIPLSVTSVDAVDSVVTPLGWTDLAHADSSIRLDLRYATKNNFVGQVLYPCERCLLRTEVARAILQIQAELRKDKLGLILFDCYRPASVQKKLWTILPDAHYVTPPTKGSMHNRGLAVDVTLFDLLNQEELDMGTPFDFFGPKAHHTYLDLSPEVLQNRQTLKGIMTRHGFGAIRTEWWHYSFRDLPSEISDFIWDCPPVKTKE